MGKSSDIDTKIADAILHGLRALLRHRPDARILRKSEIELDESRQLGKIEN